MKASALFGAGWENESVEVLWKDRERLFCRLWHDGAEGGKHAFIPFPAGTEGLDMVKVGRLFEAFYTTKTDGMGSGLLVSRSIIESHGGRLWATPNDGPGITLAFSIPSATDDGPIGTP